MLASASLRMRPLVRTLAPLVALVLLLPGLGSAAAQEDPPETTPTETSPPPADPTPPVETVITLDVPDASDTITIVVPVPPKPARKWAAVRPAVRPAVAPSVRRSDSRPAPTVSSEVVESSQSSPRGAPAQSAKPKKAAKAAKAAKTRKQTKLSPPKRSTPPRVFRPAVIRAPEHTAGGVLAARFSSASVDPSASTSNPIFYLALTLAALLAMLVALVAAAPSLAPLWPRVFVPVIRAQEQLLLGVACVICVAITLAITWALTGPGA